MLLLPRRADRRGLHLLSLPGRGGLRGGRATHPVRPAGEIQSSAGAGSLRYLHDKSPASFMSRHRSGDGYSKPLLRPAEVWRGAASGVCDAEAAAHIPQPGRVMAKPAGSDDSGEEASGVPVVRPRPAGPDDTGTGNAPGQRSYGHPASVGLKTASATAAPRAIAR